MLAMTLFHMYRRFVVVAVLVYSVIKLINFIWRWRGVTSGGRKSKRLLYRYLEVQVLRTRLWRFRKDIVQVLALAAVLMWIVSVQI